MGYDDTLFKRHMFSFDVTFFEMFNPSDDDDEEYRQDPLGIYSRKASQGSQATDQENSREFGSPMRGPFTPGQEDTEHIRETTISLLLDSLQAEKGSYWTLISIGKYDEEAAYKNPLERSGSGCPRYLSPEEVFLDKLGSLNSVGPVLHYLEANCMH